MRCLIFSSLIIITFLSSAEESTCYGDTGDGYLENGVKLPGDGPNFTSYGYIPELAGRTYVHSKVRDAIVDAYKSLEISHPEKVYKYAETGFKRGGKFKPHITHQNGLSVDFMVSVIDKQNKSIYLPTNPFNKYGYDIEFDEHGRYRKYHIDFEAMAAHIKALHFSSVKHGIKIWRVIFDPKLQPLLYQTSSGDYLRKNIYIPTKNSWVRHDEHYHIDFRIECLAIK